MFIALVLLLSVFAALAACVDTSPSEPEQPERPEPSEPIEPSEPSGPSEPVEPPEDYIFWQAQEGYSYGEIERVTYRSAVTGTDRHATIVLPAGYYESKRYPVLYLLHGLNCDDTSWTSGVYGLPMNAQYIAGNAHCFEGAPEIVIVCVNSLLNASETQPDWNSPDLTSVYDLTGREIVTSLMPFVQDNYSVSASRENTAVAGFSMGGREAILTAFAYQDKFGSVGAFSPASFGDDIISASTYVPDLALTGENFNYVQVTCGLLDTLLGVASNLKSKLEDIGITPAWSTPLGMHSPSVWREALFDFVKSAFA